MELKNRKKSPQIPIIENQVADLKQLLNEGEVISLKDCLIIEN